MPPTAKWNEAFTAEEVTHQIHNHRKSQGVARLLVPSVPHAIFAMAPIVNNMHGQSLRHVVNKLSLQHSDMDPDYTSSQFSNKYRWNTKHNSMSLRRPCNQQNFKVLSWNTVLTPAQAPTATAIVSLEPAPHHDTFWLLDIHGSMQCTAKLQ